MTSGNVDLSNNDDLKIVSDEFAKAIGTFSLSFLIHNGVINIFR